MPELTQSPERYSYKEDRWLISATGSIPPVEILEDINADTEIRLEPGLKVPGVIVHVAGTKLYWASEELITTLERDFETNPHYTYLRRTASGASAVSGSISGSVIGGTVPIITVASEQLETAIKTAKLRGKNAGVKSVEWPIAEAVDGEGTLVEKYQGLLDQINWTLSPFAAKPKDTYRIWDLGLSGDYSIEIERYTVDEANPTAGLEARLVQVSNRVAALRRDFKAITDEFHFGNIPIGATTTIYSVVASADSSEEDLDIQVISKPSQFVGLSDSLPPLVIPPIDIGSIVIPPIDLNFAPNLVIPPIDLNFVPNTVNTVTPAGGGVSPDGATPTIRINSR
jgi:hypothetical protein